METIFIITENSKTNELHRFKLDLTDKLNLKNPNKNMANLSIYCTWKNIKSEHKTINLKFQHQLGIILLMYLMVLTQFVIFKIIFNLLLKNMKL